MTHGFSSRPPTVVFLPGAGGSRDFWRPVSRHIPANWTSTLLNLPGAGNEPPQPGVSSFDDLTSHIARHVPDAADVAAQSMGGVVALGLALRFPRKVRRLVLVATSGGLNVSAAGAADWRTEYRNEYPHAARWVLEDRVDFSAELGRIAVPTLLIWGDADHVSPVAVGRNLARLLPAAELHVLPGAGHSLARTHPTEVACLIRAHLS
jgi:pimeloyl-ACP methyl ester carboxylesterase